MQEQTSKAESSSEPPEQYNEIVQKLELLFPEAEGYEFYLFKVKTYNGKVKSLFHLPFPDHSMSVIVLSTPKFFGTTFKNWLLSKKLNDESLEDFAARLTRGPIDAFFDDKFAIIRQVFQAQLVEVIRDNDLMPNRRPKILMTTCGHVAGAAHYYRPAEELLGTLGKELELRRRAGVSLHPKYGGHFAFRGVLIFPTVHLLESFEEVQVPAVLRTVTECEDAIAMFNSDWKSGKYRDAGNPVECYDELQLNYFGTETARRWPIIAHWFDKK